MKQSTGNMYEWINVTWNPIKGKCSHDCLYCYMKRFPQKPIRLDQKTLNEELGTSKVIFVGSSTDVFANDVPDEWIEAVLNKCIASRGNTFLFQTKNPKRLQLFKPYFEKLKASGSELILGTTIETNRYDKKIMGNSPTLIERATYLGQLDYQTMVTIEPIMDFDLEPFIELLKIAKPTWVNIGADSKGHKLPEPSNEKVGLLIIELQKFTEIRKKTNLDRLK